MIVKQIFIKETSSNLAELKQELCKSKGVPLSPRAVEMVLRTMHNIKGTAPMVGYQRLSEIAIPVERAFKLIQHKSVVFNANLVNRQTQNVVLILEELLVNDDAHTPCTKEEQRVLIKFFNDINRLKAQTDD